MIFYIFSFNRPFQLEALLRSLHEKTSGSFECVVQYGYSGEIFRTGYENLSSSYTNCKFVYEEGKFKETLLTCLSGLSLRTQYISFLVDDIIFLRHWNVCHVLELMEKDIIFSLRLGLNLSKTKIVKKWQSLPKLTKHDNSIYGWNWTNAPLDWGYKFSLDGNIYDFTNIKNKIFKSKFAAPNSLEGYLSKAFVNQKFRGFCFSESILVNLPFNRVQYEVANWAGVENPQDLAIKFLDGCRLNIESYEDFLQTSVHEDWIINVKKNR